MYRALLGAFVPGMAARQPDPVSRRVRLDPTLVTDAGFV